MRVRLSLVSWVAPSNGGALSHTKPVRSGCVSLGVAGPVCREVSRVACLAPDVPAVVAVSRRTEPARAPQSLCAQYHKYSTIHQTKSTDHAKHDVEPSKVRV